MNTITIDIPLRITVSVETPPPSGVPPEVTVLQPQPASLEAAADMDMERITDRDYRNRTGYSPDFLEANVPVPLPILTDAQRNNAAKNTQAEPEADDTVLPYHHFSIVMNRSRQLAYYTVVNIDGERIRDVPRSRDKWAYDPRIAESEQIGEDLYARNALDRGHLVRRRDPVWGAESEARNANADTFHFTNCSPQHERFNQNSQTWLGIEDYLLNSAVSERKRLNVFTGPVFDDEDPLYRGVRLPLRFWKIAVHAKADGSLAVSAYLLEQQSVLGDLQALARFNARVFQVTVEEISQRTTLDFSYLSSFQVDLNTGTGLERASTSTFPRRRVVELDDIVL